MKLIIKIPSLNDYLVTMHVVIIIMEKRTETFVMLIIVPILLAQ